MILVTMLLLAMTLAMPMPVSAEDGTSVYVLYDGRDTGSELTIAKVWDDGMSNDERQYESGKDVVPYEDLLRIVVRTDAPMESLRAYRISYDANGGTFGNDTSGNAIVTNVVAYDARNQVTGGAYATPTSTDGSTFLGWSTDVSATTPDPSITLTGGATDAWMCAREDGSTTVLHAVWKRDDKRTIRYAVSAYGIGIDRDADGKTMGITFGPALGYPEFSVYDGATYDASSTQAYTRSHPVSGDDTVMSETSPAVTDASRDVITGNDAGTDASGNPYRCLHHDNWATIAYWDRKDPHVYDRCVSHRCSKTVTITPTAASVTSGTFDEDIGDAYRGIAGDGQSYVVTSDWNSQNSGVDIIKAGQGYSASLVRAKLNGADRHTKADKAYAGTDAMTRYTADASILACIPKVLRDAIGAKALSGVGAACRGTGMSYDVASNDNVADRLWLPSAGEMTDAVYPNSGLSPSARSADAARANMQPIWLRSPNRAERVNSVAYDGVCAGYGSHMLSNLGIAPGFTLE